MTSPPLTSERIIDAALKLADEQGIAGVSMRKLGAALGFEAMALYYYVPNKTALLNGMLERLLQRLDVPEDETMHWIDQLRYTARSFRRIALEHPSFVGLLTTQHMHSAASLRPAEAVLTTLRGAGFGAHEARRAYQALTGYVLGAIFQESCGTIGLTCCSGTGTACDIRMVSGGAAEASAPNRFPVLLETMRSPSPGDADQDFEFGLDVVLAGLAGRLGS